jgi:hypothetical protein
MTGVMSSNGSRPEIEVAAKAKRRRYTADYKSRIRPEAAECAGERGGIATLEITWHGAIDRSTSLAPQRARRRRAIRSDRPRQI